jgi:hypothetical protein
MDGYRIGNVPMSHVAPRAYVPDMPEVKFRGKSLPCSEKLRESDLSRENHERMTQTLVYTPETQMCAQF